MVCDMSKKKTQVGFISTKYDYSFDNSQFRRFEQYSLTVPDLVMSVADIYKKYALTGDISSLPGRVRPVTFDDGDEFDETFESEEMTDSLLRAHDLRESAIMRSRKPKSDPDKSTEKSEDKELSDEDEASQSDESGNGSDSGAQ